MEATPLGGFDSRSFTEIDNSQYLLEDMMVRTSCSPLAEECIADDSISCDRSHSSTEDETSFCRTVIENEVGQKRRIYSMVHLDPKKSSRRFRANDRERRRMRSLNGALDMLRQCIPIQNGRKRMTKLEILRLACNYIDNLGEVLKLSQSNYNDKSQPNSNACMVKVINGLSVPQRIEMFACGHLWI